MKPIHKFNGGIGATLCHTCSVIISTGLTKELYCNNCKPTTLKEKFIEAFKSGKRFDIKNAEVIADEFAIGFFDWFNSKEAEDLMHDLVIVGEVDINTTTKELLEIYKKEKGL